MIKNPGAIRWCSMVIWKIRPPLSPKIRWWICLSFVQELLLGSYPLTQFGGLGKDPWPPDPTGSSTNMGMDEEAQIASRVSVGTVAVNKPWNIWNSLTPTSCPLIQNDKNNFINLFSMFGFDLLGGERILPENPEPWKRRRLYLHFKHTHPVQIFLVWFHPYCAQGKRRPFNS